MVTDHWDEHGGGRERYLAELRTWLTQHGRRVEIAAARPHGEHHLATQISAFRRAHPTRPVLAVRPADGATHYQLHSGVYADAFAAEAHAFSSPLRRMFAGTALRLNRRRQRLLHLEAQLCGPASSTQLMAFSEQSRADLRRRFAVSDARLVVARPGVDLNVFHPGAVVSRPAGPLRLLFVGHNFELKGLRFALEAVAAARQRGIDAHLTVAGRGNESRDGAMAQRLNITPHVRFAGAIDRETLASMYRASDLLMHPSFYDPFPRAIVEALACGVPVATTAACGAAEIITPGETGFVVNDPRDVSTWVGIIETMADPQRRAAMSEAAATTGRQFDFNTHAAEVAAWLEAS